MSMFVFAPSKFSLFIYCFMPRHLYVFHYVLHSCMHMHVYILNVCSCTGLFVWGTGVVTHSDQELRPLAGRVVGLAGLSRTLKQLCSSDWLLWWLWARVHVTWGKYSQELLTGRPPAVKTAQYYCILLLEAK